MDWGIGAIEFPFRGITQPNVIESYEVIRIFKTDDVILFENTEAPCDIWDDVIEISEEELFVYPNPFNGELNIYGFEEYSNVALHTLDGRYMENILSNKTDLSHLTNGLYIIIVYLKSGGPRYHKIIKQ